jgi:hypothetical protein
VNVVDSEPNADKLSLIGGNIFILERNGHSFGIRHLRHNYCTTPYNSYFFRVGIHRANFADFILDL